MGLRLPTTVKLIVSRAVSRAGRAKTKVSLAAIVKLEVTEIVTTPPGEIDTVPILVMPFFNNVMTKVAAGGVVTLKYDPES